MLKNILITLCGVGLAACASPTWDPDLTACTAEMAKARDVDTLRSRSEFLDNCMAGKGWRASPACREQMTQGTRFCDYVKSR